MKVNVDWNEWNGLMWNGVFGDPNCRKNEMNVVALWSNCMSKTELIVFDCDIGFDERIMDNMNEWLKECDNWYVCCSYDCLKVVCLIWVSMCWLVIDMIWE